MTVSAEYPYARYVATSGTTVFSFQFTVANTTDIVVTYTDSDGLVTTLTKDVDYSVTLNPDKTGSITLISAYSGGALEIRRVVPITQDIHWINHDPFNMDIFEASQDKIVRILQQFDTTLQQGLQTTSWRGNWVSGFVYKLNDNVVDGNTGNIYTCKVAHTAGATIAADIALGYWALALDVGTLNQMETNAAVSASAAATSEANAANSATDAENSATAAQAAIANTKTVVGISPINSTFNGSDIEISFDKAASNLVESVTGAEVDNTDPQNPIIKSNRVGELFMWPTDSIPSYALEADGSAISRTTYADLFALYGTIYGSGDGSTTFNIPDMRGLVPRGWDHGAGVDPDAASRTDRGDGTTGDAVGTKQADEYKSHHHQTTCLSGGTEYFTNANGTYYGGARFSITSDSKTSSDSGGNETRMKNINVIFCIYIG